MTTSNTITQLPGYEDVQDLIPGGVLLYCKDVWRLCFEHYRDEIDDLRRRMVLELARDVQDRASDRVAMIMEAPTQISFPDSWQIIGLDVEDIGERGWEGLRWRVYDCEMSGFELYCASIRFERRNYAQLGHASNGGLATPVGNSGVAEAPPLRT